MICHHSFAPFLLAIVIGSIVGWILPGLLETKRKKQ